MICENCNSNNFLDDEVSGDYVCKDCGLVSKERMLKPSIESLENEEIATIEPNTAYFFTKHVIDYLELPSGLINLVCEEYKKYKCYNTHEICMSLIIELSAKYYNRLLCKDECCRIFSLNKCIVQKNHKRSQSITMERIYTLTKFCKKLDLDTKQTNIMKRDLIKLGKMTRVSNILVTSLLFYHWSKKSFDMDRKSLENIVGKKYSMMKKVIIEIENALKDM